MSTTLPCPSGCGPIKLTADSAKFGIYSCRKCTGIWSIDYRPDLSPKKWKREPMKIFVTVRDSGSTYVARCDGLTASSTGGRLQAVKAVTQKVQIRAKKLGLIPEILCVVVPKLIQGGDGTPMVFSVEI